MNPKNIIRSDTKRARRILAAHLGIPLHIVHDRGDDYLSVDNRQFYYVLQDVSEAPGAATWYAIQPYYQIPKEPEASEEVAWGDIFPGEGE